MQRPPSVRPPRLRALAPATRPPRSCVAAARPSPRTRSMSASLPAIRLTCAPARWLSTAPSTPPTPQSESAATSEPPQPEKPSLNIDYAAKPSAAEYAAADAASEKVDYTGTAGKTAQTEQASIGTPSWPPTPENETVIITYREPWLLAVVVLAVLLVVELTLLGEVVGPEGERKILKKIEERRADARLEPSSVSLIDALKAKPPAAPK